ncbi:hypothetical protein L6452_18617 [Arctium lappa]|uniref:Uncharacterized protein n=1 Tax=Arctium lappa TaxID=4217 RepID=A0ACB9C6L2_ARCLA|nr:hypothetical protein L6452_18617 [Arctium lappa]
MLIWLDLFSYSRTRVLFLLPLSLSSSHCKVELLSPFEVWLISLSILFGTTIMAQRTRSWNYFNLLCTTFIAQSTTILVPCEFRCQTA